MGTLARDVSSHPPADDAAGTVGAAEFTPVAGPSTSSQPELEGQDFLEVFEIEAAASNKETGTTTTRKSKRSRADAGKDDLWMAKMQENIEATNLLLQQVMQERAQPVT